MRHFKSFAMIAALALGNVALADGVADSATLSLTNSSVDTLEVGTVGAFTWDAADVAGAVLSNTGSLRWTTPASNEDDRVISVSLAEALPTGVNSLKIGAGTITGSGTAAGEITLTTGGEALINAIAAYNSGSTTLTYTFDVVAGGFTSKADIVVNFTMTSPS